MKQKILFHSVLTMLLVLMQFSFVFADNISTSKSVGTPKGVLEVSATGAATYTIPISCPKGYGNMTLICLWCIIVNLVMGMLAMVVMSRACL